MYMHNLLECAHYVVTSQFIATPQSGIKFWVIFAYVHSMENLELRSHFLCYRLFLLSINIVKILSSTYQTQVAARAKHQQEQSFRALK